MTTQGITLTVFKRSAHSRLAVWRQTSKLSPDEVIYQVWRLIDAVCDDDLGESVWYDVFTRYLNDLRERCAVLEGETGE